MEGSITQVESVLDLTTKGKLGLRKKSKMPERIYPRKNERLNETTIRDGRHEKRKRLGFKIKVRRHPFDPKPRKPAKTVKTDTSKGAEGPSLLVRWCGFKAAGMAPGWVKCTTFAVRFISIIITSAPPQIIRHWILEVGDLCPKASQDLTPHLLTPTHNPTFA